MFTIPINLSRALVIVLASGVAAFGGAVSGKVSGGRGPAVVYIEAVPGKTFPAPAKHIVIDQKSLLFQPHIVVAPAGATIDFLNSDNVQHNIFWPAISGNKKLSHNMGTWPKGEIRSFKFDTPGIVPLLCNVHPEMSGYLIVTPTPYHAESDASGAYKVDNVPDGSYTLTVWREGMKPQSKPVTVTSSTAVDFTLTK